jgi:hypothetical protein
MKRRFKWLLMPAVLVAILLFAAPRAADAHGVVVRVYRPHHCYHIPYVYRYPRRVYYYAPAPVVVYRPPTIVVPALPPPPPVWGYHVW